MQTFWWIFFAFLIGFFIAYDLFSHRNKKEIGAKDALLWSGCWIAFALIFNCFVWYYKGERSALEFFAGYLIELSLSVDNLFVFLLIFQYFQVENRYQHKVLFWGIVGALCMRLVFILAGLQLIEMFHWVFYLFGLFLIITGVSMLGKKAPESIHPENNIILRFLKKFIPFQDNDEHGSFFVRHGGKLFATPLFAVLILIETTDLIFALDSIPAIFGVTLDPFIVFTSNTFAILGLRSLYFALAHTLKLFSYLHHGVCIVLIFIGCKMVLEPLLEIPIAYSLLIVSLILGTSVVLSLKATKDK